MSTHDPTEPLVRDPALDGDLRAALDAAPAHEPTPAALASLQARLAAALPPGTLPPPAPPSPAGGAAPAAASGVGAKALGAAALAGAIALGVLVTRGGEEPRPPPPLPPPTVTVAPAPVPVEAPAVDVNALPSSSASVARPVLRAPPIDAPPEGVLLRDAHQALLGGTPSRALALTNEHARAYPKGMLAQEREMIAIEALVKLGRRDEAALRARAFRAAFPGSSHGERLDRILR